MHAPVVSRHISARSAIKAVKRGVNTHTTQRHRPLAPMKHLQPKGGLGPRRLLCYLKLTDACQTKARSKKSTGMIGNTSTIGSKGAYASGNFASKKAINYKSILYEVL
jgi:hypothetical protein